jgi:hypothetical protein
MLRSKKRRTPRPSVKLFPRLATAKAATVSMRLSRPEIRARDVGIAIAGERDLERTRLRARLLKMILDNERERRNNWRPRVS